MKTLREVLLGRHQAAEPKLDAIRKKVVADMARRTSADAAADSGRMEPFGTSSSPFGWRELLWSLRWHLAGVGVAWVVAALLSIDHTPTPALHVTHRGAPSREQLSAALRENQRQLRELISAPSMESATAAHEPTPSPRSQSQVLPMAGA